MISYGFNKGTNIGAIIMKYFNTTLFLLAILIHTGNCYTLETLPADSATVDSDFTKVALNTGLKIKYVNGPFTINFYPQMSMFLFVKLNVTHFTIHFNKSIRAFQLAGCASAHHQQSIISIK